MPPIRPRRLGTRDLTLPRYRLEVISADEGAARLELDYHEARLLESFLDQEGLLEKMRTMATTPGASPSK